MAFTGFYKTDVLGQPQQTDYSLLNHVVLQGNQARAEKDMLGMKLADEKLTRAAALKKAQQDRVDKMAQTSAPIARDQDHLGRVIAASNEKIRNGQDITDDTNYAYQIAHQSSINDKNHNETYKQVEALDKSGIPQLMTQYNQKHLANKGLYQSFDPSKEDYAPTVITDEGASVANGDFYDRKHHPELHYNGLKQSTFSDKSIKDTPTGTKEVSVSGTTAFPIAEKEIDPVTGLQRVDGNNQPVFSTRAPRNEKDIIDNGYADSFLDTNPMVAHQWKNAAIDERANDIDNNIRARIQNHIQAGGSVGDDGMPTKEAVESMQNQAIKEETKKMVATILLGRDQGSKTFQFKDVKKAQPQLTDAQTKREYSVKDLGEREYNAVSVENGKVVKNTHATAGAVNITNPDGTPLTLNLTGKSMVDVELGEGKSFLGSKTVRLDKITPAYTNKQGGVSHIPKNETFVSFTKRKLKEDPNFFNNHSIEPVALVTAKGNKIDAMGNDSPMNVVTLGRLQDLKAKKEDTTGKGLTPAENEEFKKLVIESEDHSKTYRVPYKEIEGSVDAATGGKKKFKSETIFNNAGFKDQVHEAQRLIDEYKSSKKETPKTAKVGSKTYTYPQGFTEIVEVGGKKYFVNSDRSKHQLIN